MGVASGRAGSARPYIRITAMAKIDGKPSPESLSNAYEQVKRDGEAWFSAERALLHEQVQSGAKRMQLAIIVALGAVLLAIAGTIVLANVLVQLLTASLGPVIAGLVVGIALLLIGIALIAWVKALLRPTGQVSGRAQSTAKYIWSALNEPN